MEALPEECAFIKNYFSTQKLEECVISMDGDEGRNINIPGAEGLVDVAVLLPMAEVPPSHLHAVPERAGYFTITPWFDDSCKLRNIVSRKNTDEYLSSSLCQKYETFLNLQVSISKKSPKTIQVGTARSVSYEPIDSSLFAANCSRKVSTIIPTMKCKQIPLHGNIGGLDLSRFETNFKPEIVKDLQQADYYLVPRSYEGDDFDINWKVSYTQMENIIASTWNLVQFQCFSSVKALLRKYLNVPLVVTGHMIKTLMFWAIEQKPKSIWKQSLDQCIIGILENYIHALSNRNLPNFFRPSQNLLADLPEKLLTIVAFKMIGVQQNVALQQKGKSFNFCPFDQHVLPLLHLDYAPDAQGVIRNVDLAIAKVEIEASRVMKEHFEDTCKKIDAVKRIESLFQAYSYACWYRFWLKFCRGKIPGRAIDLVHKLRPLYLDLISLTATFCDSLKGDITHGKVFPKDTLLMNDIFQFFKRAGHAPWCTEEEHIRAISSHLLAMNLNAKLSKGAQGMQAISMCSNSRFLTMKFHEIDKTEPKFLNINLNVQSAYGPKPSEKVDILKAILNEESCLTKQGILDTTDGVDLLHLDHVMMNQFGNIQEKLSAPWPDVSGHCNKNAFFFSGSVADGTSLVDVQFVKHPGKINMSDIDIMLPIYQLYAGWEYKYIRSIEATPGFVNLDVTSAPEEDLSQIKKALTSKEGKTVVSADHARSWVERKMKSYRTLGRMNKNETINTIYRASTRYENWPIDITGKYNRRMFEILTNTHGVMDRSETVNANISTMEKIILRDKRGISDMDAIPTIFCEQWPSSADEWIWRALKTLNPSLVYKITSTGYQLVPKCSVRGDPVSEWRLSFSIAENILIHNWTLKQWRCFFIGKIILHFYLDLPSSVITTYHLKTVMFWACEQRRPEVWEACSLSQCLLGVFDDLIHCLTAGSLSHYFLEGVNLFAGCSSTSLMQALELLSNVRRQMENVCKNIKTSNKEEDLRHKDESKQSTFIYWMALSKTALVKVYDHARPIPWEALNGGLTTIAKLCSLQIALMVTSGVFPREVLEKGEALINAFLHVSQCHLNDFCYRMLMDIKKHIFAYGSYISKNKELPQRFHDELSNIFHEFCLEELDKEEAMVLNLGGEMMWLHMKPDTEDLHSYYFNRISEGYLCQPVNGRGPVLKLSEVIEAEKLLLTTPECPGMVWDLDASFGKYVPRGDRCLEDWHPVLEQFISWSFSIFSPEWMKQYVTQAIGSRHFHISGLSIPEKLKCKLVAGDLTEKTREKLVDFFINLYLDPENRRKLCVGIILGALQKLNPH